MGKIVVFNNVTLDGVMQAPGRPDEDTRGGFPFGGWALPYSDPVIGTVAGENMATTGGILLGRRTYEDFYKVWPKRTDNPFTEVLNKTPKYVASRTLSEPLPWMNSTLLKGDIADSVSALKQGSDKDLVLLGSGDLLQSLIRYNFIDEYILLIHPLVLGTGRRLFADATYASLELVGVVPSRSGVLIVTYRPKSEGG